MAKYVLLYTGGSGMAATPEQQAEGIKEWTAWFTSLGAGLVDPGAPFMPAVATFGPDGSAKASGYSIVEAASPEAASGMVKTCPQLKAGGTVTVFPTISMM